LLVNVAGCDICQTETPWNYFRRTERARPRPEFSGKKLISTTHATAEFEMEKVVFLFLVVSFW
jgi:epoxyqueuosine reductase QueG